MGRIVPGFSSKYARTRGSNRLRILEQIPIDNDTALIGQPHNTIEFVILDTETTGVEEEDRIVEMSMLKVYFDKTTGKYVGLGDRFSSLHDPGIDIKQDASNVNGITKKDITGQKIYTDYLKTFLQDSPIVVAFNAIFDQRMVENTFPDIPRQTWACALQEIDWSYLGHKTKRQEIILLNEGWYYDSHIAINDCYALSWLIGQVPNGVNTLETSTRTDKYMLCTKPPYNLNTINELKRNGFSWNKPEKMWWKISYEGDIEYIENNLNEYYDYYECSYRENLGLGNYLVKRD